MNKKIIGVILTVFLLSVFMINFISATTLLEGITSVADSIKQILEPMFKFLLGDVGEGLLFGKVLFFVMIIGIVWLSLSKIDFFSDNRLVLGIITFSVAVLAVRGIASLELIKTILLPYSVLGVALVAGIPFVIYFIVINVGFKEQSSIVRKVAWIFFAVIFIGLWFSRKDSLGEFHYIYLITSVAAVIMAWVDGTIKKFFLKIEVDKLKDVNRTAAIAEWKKRIGEAEENKYMTDSERKELIKHYQKQIKRRSK